MTEAAPKFPLMAVEFFEFDQATLPEIPADWWEYSWHNDTCPSFGPREYQDGQPFTQVYIDWADPAERESARGDGRFMIVVTDADGDHDPSGDFASDDWAEILAELAKRESQG